MSDTFDVKLPAEMKPFLEADAKANGFSSVAAYVAFLARANAPIDLRNDPKLKAALLDGFRSEPLVADEAFWEEFRRPAKKSTKLRKRSA